MRRPPRAPWLASRVGCAILLTYILALSRARAQQAGAPAPPLNTEGEQAAGAQPARPEPGAGVQPTPPPTTEIKPTPPPPAAARPPEAVPGPAPTPPLKQDDQHDAGYLPGYKPYPSLGLGPHVPRVPALPGGVTPGYGAPMPPGEWIFEWSGYLSASAQFSTNKRELPQPGQSTTVFHVPPATLDEYQSFVGTSTMPGQWVAMNFKYGNRDVSAVLTLSTWNPTEPTTYYQIGSQGFVNNAYLAYNLPSFGRLALHATIGYFYNNYGNLGQYGPGIYQSPIAGGPRGIGWDLLGEYQLSPELLLLVEEGFVGNRNGKAPAGITPAAPNSSADPSFPAAFVHHLHAGLIRRGSLVLKLNLHWMYNFSADDRPQESCFQTSDASGVVCTPNVDNMTTRGIDEAYIPDAHISVYGVDATVSHSIWGQLSAGAAHISAANAFLLRGLLTYGGEGQPLTERWLGVDNGGTGQVDVAGINYNGSLGRMISAPAPFDSNGPDLILNAGAIVATSRSGNPIYDHRLRYKFGVDALYAFMPNMAFGARFDRVSPNSKDPNEAFDVVMARLVFKTDWASRETISLIYARWFLGSATHREYSSKLLPFEIDDQLIALNVNMWW